MFRKFCMSKRKNLDRRGVSRAPPLDPSMILDLLFDPKDHSLEQETLNVRHIAGTKSLDLKYRVFFGKSINYPSHETGCCLIVQN